MLPTRSKRPIIFNRGIIAETGIIPPGYQLFQDTTAFTPLEVKKVMIEGLDKKAEPVMKVKGLFQEADRENANGREYPLPVMQYAVTTLQPDIDKRAVLAEYDHPTDAKIHLDRVSHLITKCWMDGPHVYGEAEVLDNQPLGRCLRGLFERKVRIGISSRGIGDMELIEGTEGKQRYRVKEGYQIVTFDAVAEPSVDGATLSVMESLKRQLKPIHEQARRDELFNRTEYEGVLLEEINRFFGIRDFGPRRRVRVKNAAPRPY